MGYFLADYVVAHWDKQALVSLIRSNGDIEQSLGVHSGKTQRLGGWEVSDTDELCLGVDQLEPRCSRLYEKAQSLYLVASDADCVFQEWRLTPGDSQRLGAN